MTEQLAYNIAQAADAVGVSVTTVKRAIAAGSLRVRYLGRGRTKPSIDRDDLIAWIKSAPSQRTA